ncbi:MAG: ankyrin repeat domain-containing protein [Planctomycetota bacterium]
MDIQIHKDIRAAIKQGNLERVADLIGSDQSRLNMMTPFGTWLHVAAAQGKLQIVKWLVENGLDINAEGGIAGGGALHVAASDGHLDIVRYLTDRGAHLDVSKSERNPLFGAICIGHTSIAKFLIESGIDTRIQYTTKTMGNMDALAFAREWGRSDIVELLNE